MPWATHVRIKGWQCFRLLRVGRGLCEAPVPFCGACRYPGLLSFCCLLPVFPPTELPFPLPVTQCRCLLCTGCAWTWACSAPLWVCMAAAVTSLLCTSLLCAHLSLSTTAVNKMIGP